MTIGKLCAGTSRLKFGRLSFGLGALLACSGAWAQDNGAPVEGPEINLERGDIAAAAEPANSEPAPKPSPKPFDAELVVSQFVDAPISGDARSVARYGGRADAFFRLRGHAFGGPSNLSLKVRPEIRWGKDSIGEVGLIPSNTALFRAGDRGDFDVTASLEYKFSGAKGPTIELGKINLLERTLNTPIVSSDGHFGFQNIGLAIPPTSIAPNTITGVTVSVPTKTAIYQVWVFDAANQYQKTGFENPFEQGVAFLTSATFLPKIGGKPGFYTVALAGSTRDDFARDLLPAALTPPPQPIATFGNESGEIALQLSGYQFVETYADAPGKGWGILARFQASGGDPTFLDYSGYLGVSGNPRFRPQDRFGLGVFRYSLTNELVDDIAFRLPIENETGLEAFYTYQFDKNHGLTANVQVIDSAVAARRTGVTLGARLTSVF